MTVTHDLPPIFYPVESCEMPKPYSLYFIECNISPGRRPARICRRIDRLPQGACSSVLCNRGWGRRAIMVQAPCGCAACGTSMQLRTHQLQNAIWMCDISGGAAPFIPLAPLIVSIQTLDLPTTQVPRPRRHCVYREDRAATPMVFQGSSTSISPCHPTTGRTSWWCTPTSHIGWTATSPCLSCSRGRASTMCLGSTLSTPAGVTGMIRRSFSCSCVYASMSSSTTTAGSRGLVNRPDYVFASGHCQRCKCAP